MAEPDFQVPVRGGVWSLTQGVGAGAGVAGRLDFWFPEVAPDLLGPGGGATLKESGMTFTS